MTARTHPLAPPARNRFVTLTARCRPRTLRGRLSLVALTTAALVMVILTVVFHTVVRLHLQQQADDELRTRAAAVAATVDTRHRPVRVLETPDDAVLDTNVWIYAGNAAAGAPRLHGARRPPQPHRRGSRRARRRTLRRGDGR